MAGLLTYPIPGGAFPFLQAGTVADWIPGIHARWGVGFTATGIVPDSSPDSLLMQ